MAGLEAAASESSTEPAADDPAVLSLELLEWPRLSSQVAGFAATRPCRDALEPGLPVAHGLEVSELLHRETEEAWAIEQVQARSIELRGFADIAPLVTHASKGGMLEGSDLIAVAESLAVAASLVQTLNDGAAAAGGAGEAGTAAVVELPRLFEGLPVQAELRRSIVDAIDDAGEVRDTADPQLGDLRFARREVATAARRELGRIIQLKSDALASSAATLRDERYVLQVVAKQKHRVPGTVRDVSASGATLYIEPRAVEPVNTKIRQLDKRCASIERAVLKRLSALVGTAKVADELARLQEAVTRVDAAVSRARYSAKLRGQPVAFVDPEEAASRGLQLSALRHPLLVWRASGEAPDDSQMVPMEVRVPPAARAVVITGPNTGGKTVCLKTVGMAALMAKAGLRVLAAEEPDGSPVRMPHFESVMADIGDDQSIVQSLSTFSAHVARMKRIMDAANAARGKCLVLLDEVGSGTDPTEGSALGMAVLRRLSTDAALTLATTHHGRLKALKYAPDANGRFENAAVEFDVASMAPTYRMLWGIPGKSNALAIAERLGLQGDVVDDARALLGDEADASVEDVVSALTAQREEQRTLNEELVALRDASAASKASLDSRAAALSRDEQGLRREAAETLEAELAEARATIAELVKRAQRPDLGEKERLREAQAASQDLARLRDGAGKAGGGGEGGGGGGDGAGGGAGAIDHRFIAIGDRVVVPRLGTDPVTVEARKGTQLTIVYGGLTMRVKAREVTEVLRAEPSPSAARPAKRGGQGKGASGGKASTKASKSAVAVRLDANTLDIRGMYAGEIDGPLGTAVDRAVGMGSLWVIHGHGTGSLKKRVRELLAEEPMVARWEDAPQREGGAGCTVAYLK